MNKRSLSGHLLVTNSSFYGILRRHKFFLQQLGAAKNMDLQNAFALTPSRRNCRNCKNCPLSGRSRSFAGIKVQSCSVQSLSILCNKCHILFLFNVLFSHSQFVLFFLQKKYHITCLLHVLFSHSLQCFNRDKN